MCIGREPFNTGIVKSIIKYSKPGYCFFIMFLTSVLLETSQWTNIASLPAFFTSLIVSFSLSSIQSATTTFAHRFAKVTAAALPIPKLPPVTSDTLTSNIFSIK